MKNSLSAPKVQQNLARYHMRKRVFAITGVKVAFGAKVKNTESHHGTVDASIGLDGDAIGMPLSAGPRAEIHRGTSQSVSFKEFSPFLFAYQLREIRYRKGIPTESKPYRNGALCELGQNRQEGPGMETDTAQHEEAISMFIDDEDVTGEDLDYGSISVPEYGVIVDEQGEDSKTGQEETCRLIII